MDVIYGWSLGPLERRIPPSIRLAGQVEAPHIPVLLKVDVAALALERGVLAELKYQGVLLHKHQTTA